MSEFLPIDDKLYAELKKLVGAHPLCLFTSDGAFVEVFRKSEFLFRVPVGFFAGAGVALRGRVFPAAGALMADAGALRLPKLYPAQQQVVAALRARAKVCARERRPLYVTLHLACGFGKTVMASYLIGAHRRRAVVCVPNKMLLAQWGAALAALRVRVHVSGEGVSRLLPLLRAQDFSVLVVVNKHFANAAFCALVHARYEVFVLDESHTYNLMNLTLMTRFLSFHPPRICYFLTATPRPGNRVYCNYVVNVTKFSALRKQLRVVSPFFAPYSSARVREAVQRLDSAGNKYHIYTEKALAEDEPRNAAILAAVGAAYEARAVQRVLVITKLRAHMRALHAGLLARFGAEQVFLGDAQDKQTAAVVRQLRELDRFLFVSTLFYSGTGLDIPTLDALVVCHAVMNSMQAEQLLGRICRETEQTQRTVYVFPTTSVREIKNLVGMFTQRFISLATQKLGFVRVPDDAPDARERAKGERAELPPTGEASKQSAPAARPEKDSPKASRSEAAPVRAAKPRDPRTQVPASAARAAKTPGTPSKARRKSRASKAASQPRARARGARALTE
ncbi:DNA helicase [Equine molluscum contagiosum-like virus]|nr:DNA helicase [Equine molluscum contagiosum-like virus]